MNKPFVRVHRKMRFFSRLAACLFLLSLTWRAIPSAWAQPGTWDVSFPTSSLAGVAILVQPDGKILTCWGNGLIRLNADGSADPSFPVVTVVWLGGPGPVDALAIQLDGKILLGGTFDHVQGQRSTNICRVNSDGTPDPAFQPPNMDGMDGWVQQIVVQPDGAILIGGVFKLNGLAEFQYLAPLASGHIPLNINWLDESFSENTPLSCVNNCGRGSCWNTLILKTCRILLRLGSSFNSFLTIPTRIYTQTAIHICVFTALSE